MSIPSTGPDYLERAFPRDDFPRYVEERRPASAPADVWTTETTHRDGQQGGLPLTREQGARVFDAMCAFTGESGAIRQAEFFVYRAADRAMLQDALERRASGAPIEPTTWIRASARDVELIAELGVRETGMLASISDYHTFHKFSPPGRAAATSAYLDAVERVLDRGIRPRLHLEDATRAPEHVLLGFVEGVLERASRYPDVAPPKFRLCDTMGLGLPFDDVAWPRSIPRMIAAVRGLGVTSEQLEFHPHNDLHMVVANCVAALRAGCSAINGTLLGKGERTGNAPLEGVLLHAIGMGYFPIRRPDFRTLGALADLYAELGSPVPPKYPLYGRDAHRTRAGIHADGLNKYFWMYAPFDVPTLLGRPLEVSITKESGLAGLQFLIRQHTGSEWTKDDDRLRALHAWVEAEFDHGRQTAIEWEEIATRLAA